MKTIHYWDEIVNACLQVLFCIFYCRKWNRKVPNIFHIQVFNVFCIEKLCFHQQNGKLYYTHHTASLFHASFFFFFSSVGEIYIVISYCIFILPEIFFVLYELVTRSVVLDVLDVVYCCVRYTDQDEGQNYTSPILSVAWAMLM